MVAAEAAGTCRAAFVTEAEESPVGAALPEDGAPDDGVPAPEEDELPEVVPDVVPGVFPEVFPEVLPELLPELGGVGPTMGKPPTGSNMAISDGVERRG